MTTEIQLPEGLVSGERLLADLFPDAASRPSPRWLRYQVKRGGLPSYRLGGMIRFDPVQVRAWIAANCAQQGGTKKTNA